MMQHNVSTEAKRVAGEVLGGCWSVAANSVRSQVM